MKELGQGWQYTAYDLGNGRVLKKSNSALRTCQQIFFDTLKSKPYKIYKLPLYYMRTKKHAGESMGIAAGGLLENWMMGNPRIISNFEYEQDKMLPLYDLITECGIEEGKHWVDKFIEFNKLLLGLGIIDKSFSITKNFGIDLQGRIVLMDLGELYSSKAAIDIQRQKRMWAYPYAVKRTLNKEVQKYYITQMDKHFGLL